jgi:TonB family protein
MQFEQSMPGGQGYFDQSSHERRSRPRLHLPSLAYVELGDGNGGIILNLSESGLAVQAAMSFADDAFPLVRFQLAPSKDWIEAGAKIVWRGDTRKLAGLQFVDLPSEASLRIRDWISREAASLAVSDEESPSEEVTEPSQPGDEHIPRENPAPEIQPVDTSASLGDSEEVRPLQVEDEEKFTWSPETGFVRLAPHGPREKSAPPIDLPVVESRASDEGSKNAEVEQDEKFIWRPDTGFTRISQDREGLEGQPPAIAGSAETPSIADSETLEFPRDGILDRRGQSATESFAPHELYRSQMHVVEKPENPPVLPDSETPQRLDDNLLSEHHGDVPGRFSRSLSHERNSYATELPLNATRTLRDTGPARESWETGGPPARSRGIPSKPDAKRSAAKPGGRREPHWSVTGSLPLVILALAASAIGWLLGRSSLGRGPESGGPSAFQESASSPSEPTGQTAITAQVPDLQIVDAHKQSWTIPFEAPPSPLGQSPGQFKSTYSVNETDRNQGPAERETSTLEVQPDVSSHAPDSQNNSPAAGSSSMNESASSSPTETDSNAAPPSQLDSSPEPASDGVQRGILIHRVEPIYPPEAEQHGIEGDVKLRITVGSDGSVRFVQLLSGPRALAQSAIEAVQQWRFSPTLLNGNPVEATGNITISFHLTYPRAGQNSND